MRRILFCVALIVTSIVFTSCSKEKTIIGSWTLTVATQSYSDIEVLSGGEIWTFFAPDGRGSKDFRIAHTDGSTHKGTYYLDGNRLTLSYDNHYPSLVDFNILNLNNKEMSLCAEYGDILDFVKTK